jgi:hypothetical protein
LSDVVKYHGDDALASVIAIETMIWLFGFLSSVMISIVNQLSYNEKKIIANNQSINANMELKVGQVNFITILWLDMCQKWWWNTTLIISTMLIIFLSNSGIYRVKDMKKPYESYYDIFIFWVFICLGFYWALMMLLCESSFGFVIMMRVSIELYVQYL